MCAGRHRRARFSDVVEFSTQVAASPTVSGVAKGLDARRTPLSFEPFYDITLADAFVLGKDGLRVQILKSGHVTPILLATELQASGRAGKAYRPEGAGARKREAAKERADRSPPPAKRPRPVAKKKLQGDGVGVCKWYNNGNEYFVQLQ
eukprot:gene8638-10251_t